MLVEPLESSPDSISPQQQDRLAELEEIIEKGLPSFIAVGRALASVRVERLYLPRYGSFSQYCEQRWEIGVRHARRLCAAAEITENLSLLAGAGESEEDCPLPDSETAVRPLAAFEPPLQAAVWRLASALTPEPNARIVGRIVGVVRRAIEESTKGTNGVGRVPRQAQLETSRNSTKFLLSLHQLADNRYSPYLVVEQLNEAAARSLLASCQRLIMQSHEFIEVIRARFPTM